MTNAAGDAFANLPKAMTQNLPSVSVSSVLHSGDVWIRFITPVTAVANVNLSRIPIYPKPFSYSTRILDIAAQLRVQIELQIAKTQPQHGSGASYDNDFEVDLHTASFHMNEPSATLRDYALDGSQKSPLDIYVIKRCTQVQTVLSPEVEDYNGLSASPSWCPMPNTTPASLATFLSSLYMLRMKLTDETIRRRILTALWETTHFPPVVRAMAILFDNGVLREADKAVLAQTFFALTKDSVPGWVTVKGDLSRILESSRQIIGWLVDQVMSRKRGGSGSDSEDAWCPKVIVEPKTGNLDLDRDDGSVLVTTPLPAPATGSLYRVRYLSTDDRTHPSPEQLALAFANSAVHGGNTYLVFPRRFSNYQLHRLVSHPSPEGFYELVVNTNSIPALSIVAPLSLTRQQPPCLTLDENGQVAVWDLGRPCSAEWAKYWSPVSGEKSVPSNDRGQRMAKLLEPIVQTKKQQGLWPVDGWDIGGINISSVDTRQPSEAVVICMDVSSSMVCDSGLSFGYSRLFPESDSMSRLGRAKELFKTFSQTVSNLDVPVYFGGFSFDTDVCVFEAMKAHMTPLIDHVWNEVEALKARGGTALWDALFEAGEMLLRFKAAQPGSKLRIIALTDGENNSSHRQAMEVLRHLWSHKIVVDSVVIGDSVPGSHEIFKFSKATGGYGIRPISVADLTEIGQMETLVDINLRPKNMNAPLNILPIWEEIPMTATYDLSRPPPIAPHPNQNDTFIKLNFAQRAFRKKGTCVGNTAAATSARRLMEEIQDTAKHPHPNMDAFVSEQNLFVWKVIMEGPSQTTYEGGTFVFLMDMTDDFPIRPPKLRFLTPILHPNITKQGRVCHPILDDAWRSSTPLREVMNHMFGLLISPEIEGAAVDVMSTLGYMSSDRMFTAEVAAHIRKHAKQSRLGLSQAISSPEPSGAPDLRALMFQGSAGSQIGTPTSTIFTPRSEDDFDALTITSSVWGDVSDA